MKIIASIVLYNSDEDKLRKAIDSFLRTSIDVKLVLVDNSPTDDLRKFTIDNDRIEYIYTGENRGFGAGHNTAIKNYVQSSEYFLVLNPDIYFETGTLEGITDFLDKNPSIGLLMPKILSPNGETQFLCKRNPTPIDFFLRAFAPTFIKSFFRKKMHLFEYRDMDYNKIMHNIPYLSGCFMFFRSSILDTLKGFDENIFMYIEDADITRRTLSISNTSYYPHVEVYHYHEKGNHKNLNLMLTCIYSAYYYYFKWNILNNLRCIKWKKSF